jgi:hypothetical protein
VVQRPLQKPPSLLHQKPAVNDKIEPSLQKKAEPKIEEAALGSPTGDELSIEKRFKPAVGSKQRSRSAKRAPQATDKSVMKSELRQGRWARRDERRRRFGLFRRRFATSGATW